MPSSQRQTKIKNASKDFLQNWIKSMQAIRGFLPNDMKVLTAIRGFLSNDMEVLIENKGLSENGMKAMIVGNNLQRAEIKPNFVCKSHNFHCIIVVLTDFFHILSTANGEIHRYTLKKELIKTWNIMFKISRINIQRMNNGAHFTFASNILARAEADNTVNTKASELVSNLKTAVNAEDEALNISQKSHFTDEIVKANKSRDTLYRGYRKAVKAFLCMPDANMSGAAKVLIQHIKNYKINPRYQLDKKTGLLINFINDLENTYSAQVATLGLTIFVTKMKEANEQVMNSTLQRTNERMGITVGALRTARIVTDEAYRALTKMVNALAVVYGEDDYISFIDYVNAEITHYKREVLGQKTTANAIMAVDSDNESEASPQPTPIGME